MEKYEHFNPNQRYFIHCYLFFSVKNVDKLLKILNLICYQL